MQFEQESMFTVFARFIIERPMNFNPESFWNKIPEQVKRLAILVVILFALFVVVRTVLVPSDFGEYGHFRASALEEIASQEIRYAGHEICTDCHDDVAETKRVGFHRNVACEVCHGPAAGHIDDPEEVVKDRSLYNLVTVITMSDRICQKFGTGWRKAYGDEVDFGNLPEVLGFDEESLAEVLESIQAVFKDEISQY